MTWKCRLHKFPPEGVRNVLRGLPEWCIQEAVTEYNNRDALTPKEEKDVFLLSRDASITDRHKAAKHFIDYCLNKNNGTLKPSHVEHLKVGKMPYGWFAAYARDHPQIARVSKGPRYVSILKMYEKAVMAHFSRGPTVVGDPLDGDRDEQDNPYARFKYGTPRKGQQYYSSMWNVKRDFERRRSHGGGRHKCAGIIRELLMQWYNMMRHSVDCKIMVRFP